jgi:hypothetical protein
MPNFNDFHIPKRDTHVFCPMSKTDPFSPDFAVEHAYPLAPRVTPSRGCFYMHILEQCPRIVGRQYFTRGKLMHLPSYGMLKKQQGNRLLETVLQHRARCSSFCYCSYIIQMSAIYNYTWVALTIDTLNVRR